MERVSFVQRTRLPMASEAESWPMNVSNRCQPSVHRQSDQPAATVCLPDVDSACQIGGRAHPHRHRQHPQDRTRRRRFRGLWVGDDEEPVAIDAVLVVSFGPLGLASCRMVGDASAVLARFDDLVRVGDWPVAFTQRAGRDDTVGDELKRATTDVGPQAAIGQRLLDMFGAPATEQCRIGWLVAGLGTERSEAHPCQRKPTDGAQCGRIRSHTWMMPKIGPPVGVALSLKPIIGALIFSLTGRPQVAACASAQSRQQAVIRIDRHDLRGQVARS